MCEECYADNNRITPLLKPEECLQNHTQYICGSCGRCICIGQDSVRNLQRWNFPFKSAVIAQLYLRTADFTSKASCAIYEISSLNGRKSYKIFTGKEALEIYLKKNKDKICADTKPIFSVDNYQEFPKTQIKRLTTDEIKKYMVEKN